MKQPTRPAAELPAKAPTTPGLIRYAAALLCATLLLCISHPSGHNTSYAAGDDETAWQGTVKVVTSTHEESDKTENHPPATEHRAHRYRRDTTATYTGFHILPENEEMRSWRGPANVNLTLNGSYYSFNTSTFVGPTGTAYEEHGYDTTTTGATVAQGVVKFFRYRSQDDPRKTRCRIEVDAASDWRDRPELKIWETGRSWSKSIYPRTAPKNWDRAVKEQQILAPTFVGVSFDCDPKAASYSGQQDTWKGSPTSSQVVTWNISHRPSDVEAVIVPSNAYDTWVPEGGEDEDTPANTIVVRARVHKKGQPQKSSPQAAKFKFQLVEVSKEQGVCLNWPREGKSDFDLKIQPEVNDQLKVAADGQSAESKGNLKESSVIITSYDWGAYGKLKVTAIYEDGHEEEAHVEGDASKGALTIPKDDNGNHIADFWEKHYAGGKSDEKADDDLVPIGNSDKGDGLSLYEEYRGFRVQGEHICTNPILKDLFIYDPENLGLGLFSESELTTHIVDWNEFKMEGGATNPRVINFNRGFGTRGPQHLLRLKNEVMPGCLGDADGTGPGPPKTCSMLKIDVARCLEYGQEQLDHTIAHELAHGCNVWHHGDDDYEISRWRELQPDGTWGAWLHYADGSTLGVAAQGGQESGVEECIMRYRGRDLFEKLEGGDIQWQLGRDLIRGAKYPPIEPPGTIFCDQDEGTGVNRPGGPKLSYASKGKCRKQFCVNDTKH